MTTRRRVLTTNLAGAAFALLAVAAAGATPAAANSGLDSVGSVAVSSDGKSLYASSEEDDAVARFTRNTTTGALTYNNCITGESESGPAGTGACAAIPKAAASGDASGLNG